MSYTSLAVNGDKNDFKDGDCRDLVNLPVHSMFLVILIPKSAKKFVLNS